MEPQYKVTVSYLGSVIHVSYTRLLEEAIELEHEFIDRLGPEYDVRVMQMPRRAARQQYPRIDVRASSNEPPYDPEYYDGVDFHDKTDFTFSPSSKPLLQPALAAECVPDDEEI